MRIVIAGAGAIGGYIGARLARAGADVVLFARGPHLKAMQERGLRVLSAEDGDFEVRLAAPERSGGGPQVTGDLASVGKADVVFLGVKAHALTGLAPSLPQLFGPDTIVVSTQMRSAATKSGVRARPSVKRLARLPLPVIVA